MNTLQLLESNKEWLSIGQIIKETGMSAGKVREELKIFLEEELVIKTGKLKGTRYAIFGTEVPSDKPEDFRKAILAVMRERKDKIDRKTLCQILKTFDKKVKDPLMELIEEGTVSHNSKKKGQLFWLTEYEKEGIIKPEPKAEPKPQSSRRFKLKEEEQEDLEPITDIVELIKFGLTKIPDGEEFMVMDLGKIIMASHNNHPFHSLHVINSLARVYRENLDERLHIVERDGEYGRRHFYCVGKADQWLGERINRKLSSQKDPEKMGTDLEKAMASGAIKE